MKSLIILFLIVFSAYALPTGHEDRNLVKFCASLVQMRNSSSPEEIAQFEENLQKFGVKPEDCKLFQMDVENKMAAVMQEEIDEPVMKDLDYSLLENEAEKSFTMSDCINCTDDTNDDIKEFTATLNETSSDDETLKLAGIVIGCVLAVVLVILVIIYGVKFAHQKCFKNKQAQNSKPRQAFHFSQRRV